MLDKSKQYILIVEPDRPAASLIKSILIKNGFSNVDFVSTGEDALVRLDMITSEKSTGTPLISFPDMIIINAHLPSMSGFEFSKKIKASMPDVCVVIMVNRSIKNFRTHLNDSNADDFFNTSLTSPDELVSRIGFLLEKQTEPAEKKEEIDKYQLPHVGDSIDDYAITDSLAWSKSCIIYKVMKSSSGELFALKLLTRYAVDIDSILNRFKEEINLMSLIKHHNIMGLIDYGTYRECPYLVMELINGVNLEEYLISRGTPGLKTFFNVTKEISTAIQAVHEAGYIHKDIKLSNIMIGRNMERSVLTDFGISEKPVMGENALKPKTMNGTLMYMAPENFKSHNPTTRSDIYSFGVTMYHFLTGVPPFVANSMIDISEKHVNARPRSIRLLRPDVPEDLDSFIIDECMAKSPNDRPDSMNEVIKRLVEIERRNKMTRESKESPQVVLIVDDEENILNSIRRQLIEEPYELLLASGPKQALDILEERKVQVLITDYRMPEMTGIELAIAVRQRWPDTIRMILSAYSDVDAILTSINEGHVYKFLNKPWDEHDLALSIRLALETYELNERNANLVEVVEEQNANLKELNSNLEKKVEEQTASLQDATKHLSRFFRGIVDTFSGIMELKSFSMPNHGKRVAYFSCELAKALDEIPENIQDLEIASFLHDIGNISIPDNWRDMRDVEFELLNRQHPTTGYKVLSGIPDFEQIADIVKYHHEQFDGDGFPASLAGEQIQLGARILAVADNFDNFMKPTEEPSFKNMQQVEKYMKSLAGTLLDPVLVDIFLEKILTQADLDYYQNRISLDLLKPGMELAHDLCTRSGEVLYEKGTKLMAEQIEIIYNTPDLDLEDSKIAIINTSLLRHSQQMQLPSSNIGLGTRNVHQYPDDKLIKMLSHEDISYDYSNMKVDK